MNNICFPYYGNFYFSDDYADRRLVVAFLNDLQTGKMAISIYLNQFSQEFIFTDQVYTPGLNDIITIGAPMSFVDTNPSYVLVWDVRLFSGSYMHHKNSGDWYRTVVYDQ